MKLDEAIQHCLESAERMEGPYGNTKCAADHRQLAEWLKELKELRERMEDDLK
mgnify:CR=1 FL=1